MSSSPHLTCEAIQIYHPLLAPHDFHSLFQQQLNLTVFSLNYPSFPPYIWKNCVFASDDPRVKDMFLQKFPFHSTQNAEIMSLDKQSCIYFLWAHIDLMFWNGSSPTDSEFLCAKLILKSSTHTHTHTLLQGLEKLPSAKRTAFRLHQTPGSQLFNCTERITSQQQRVFLEAPNQKVSNQKLRNLPGLVFGPPGHPISAVEMGKSWRPHLSRAYRLQPQATFFLNKSCHSYLCILQSHKKRGEISVHCSPTK